MQQFASRDLMVTELPEQAGDNWEAMGDCVDCTSCTNNTSTSKPRPKPKPKPNWKSAGDGDLLALQEQLRSVRR